MAKKTKKTTISFDYIKSNQFRVIHADGIHGGICPNGKTIQIAFFSERQPIPKQEVYQVENGRLGDLVDKTVRTDIIREVETEVLIGLEAAKALKKWLEEKIEQSQKLEEVK